MSSSRQRPSRLVLASAYARSLLAAHGAGSPSPISASFAITDRCNLRCNYCNTPFLDTTDPSLEDIERVFDRLRALGVKRLGLTGGEPLIRRDLGEILELARRRGFFITLNSNLTLFDRRRHVLDEVDLFFTSLDGDREAHEASRGVKSFDGVLDAIARLSAEGRSVVAICVVSESSLNSARRLIALADRHGFKLHFQPQCTDTTIVRGRVADSLTRDRLRNYWRELAALRRAGAPIASSLPYLETLATRERFSETAWYDPNARCVAGRAFLYVDPHCLAYPCAYTRGQVEPVSLLGPDWRTAVGRSTPCTRCNVGPYLEFNLLYDQPVRAALSALKSYV